MLKSTMLRASTLSSAAAVHTQIIDHDALTMRHLKAWNAMQGGNRELDSPYFHPGFTAAVHEVCGNVQVAVGTRPDGTISYLFPFQLHDRIVRPVGWPMADMQGPIAMPGTAVDPTALLRAAGARRLHFDHLRGDAEGFDPWVYESHLSPYLDVTGGLDGYLGRASRAGRENMAQARRKINKAARELGAIRFVADCMDPATLDRIVALKRAQYAATGVADVLANPALRALLHHLLPVRQSSFGGVLSAVFAGEQLLAAHFGLRAGGTFHWWFPVYDPVHSGLAPGWILLRELVAAAPTMGVCRIDLGRGEEEYKRRAMTGHTEVREGVVTAGVMSGGIYRLRRGFIRKAMSSRLGPIARRSVRQLRIRRNRAMLSAERDGGSQR